jgi:hypothetical protein
MGSSKKSMSSSTNRVHASATWICPPPKNVLVGLCCIFGIKFIPYIDPMPKLASSNNILEVARRSLVPHFILKDKLVTSIYIKGKHVNSQQ